MNQDSLKFSALETAHVIPVLGCKNHIAVARHLHSLGTTHAYRALGGMLSSCLLVNVDSNQNTSSYAHNEVWLHSRSSMETVAGNCSSHIAKTNAWDVVDFFVLLTVYNSSAANTQKLEVRVVINSVDQASPRTVKEFGKFVLSLWGLWNNRPLYFKGVEDYLLDSLPGVVCSKRIRCFNYSVDNTDWQRAFNPGQFSESAVSHDLELQMCQIQSRDIDVIQKLNVIDYDPEYLELCCPVTACIRRSSDAAPVSWVVCHADYQIGALLTVDQYRSRGLAKYILHSLGNKMIAQFAAKIALLYDDCTVNSAFKLQMVTELTNINTQRLFERFGFKPVDNVSWAECKFDIQKHQHKHNIAYSKL
ncbi:hypothetical protein IW136_003246 [Coemansia sp. RSA 678]|nr:hypothetical protein IW136_003246 [Coemansia sp. RSA 678]